MEKAYSAKSGNPEGRLNLSVAYGLGAVYGKEAMHEETFLLPREYCVKEFYWVNSARFLCAYNFDLSWELEVGLGYMWGKETDRSYIAIYMADGSCIATGPDWHISTLNPSLSIKFLKNSNRFIRIGFEWYFTKGVNHAGISIIPYKWENYTLITKGMAPGFFGEAGISPPLTSALNLEISVVGRFGWIWNSEYPMKDKVVKASSAIWHHFTGLYLVAGLRYNIDAGW